MVLLNLYKLSPDPTEEKEKCYNMTLTVNLLTSCSLSVRKLRHLPEDTTSQQSYCFDTNMISKRPPPHHLLSPED